MDNKMDCRYCTDHRRAECCESCLNGMLNTQSELNIQLHNKMAAMNDLRYVAMWVYQASPENIPGNIYDLAARALGEPSLAHGMAPAPDEIEKEVFKA